MSQNINIAFQIKEQQTYIINKSTENLTVLPSFFLKYFTSFSEIETTNNCKNLL